MPDYRHDLSSASSSRPSPAQADGVVELARLADVVGLDLVTFQDHPYQPRFLDTWTLLSVVAAQTTNVRLAPNVANLPLRPPVVLARSAASLDILSGGRVELGLGAGAFWDAIAADGRPAADARARASTRSPRRSTSSARSGAGGEPVRARRRALPGRRREARAGAGARHRDLARRLQAADAAPHRRARPTAGCRAWPTSSSSELPDMNAAIDEAADERRAPSRGDPPAVQRQRQLRQRQRLPAGRPAATGPSSSPS